MDIQIIVYKIKWLRFVTRLACRPVDFIGCPVMIPVDFPKLARVRVGFADLYRWRRFRRGEARSLLLRRGWPISPGSFLFPLSPESLSPVPAPPGNMAESGLFDGGWALFSEQ